MLLPFLKPPAVVIVYLQNPRERYWGVVRGLDATGIVLRGADLDSFDEWVRRVAAGEGGPEPSLIFFPLARVEKVLVDEAAGEAPSLAQQFERRVGRSLVSYLAVER
jgi:hypothetical protein